MLSIYITFSRFCKKEPRNMKQIKNGLQFFTLVLVILIGFSSCVRERDTDTSMAEDEALSEFVYHDALSIADDAATKLTGETLSNYKTSGYCATITHNAGSIVIDFDTVNCMCNDGRNRRGKILVSYTGVYNSTGSITNISFEKYYVNDNLIMGTCDVLKKGLNVFNQSEYSLTTNGKILKGAILDTLYWNANELRTWTVGEDTPMWLDDVYEITGKSTGRNTNKIYFAANITEPIIKEVSCRYINRGKVEIQPQGKALRMLNFGEGTCENDATVEINNKRYNIKL